MTSGPWLDAREHAAWRGLVRMQSQLTSELARRLARGSDLSYPDYEVLAVLTEQPDGRLRLFELAHELGWEKSRSSHHIRRMEERGLVAKERCAEDRRGWFVEVTDAGRRAIAEAAPDHVAAVRELFVDRLTSEQIDVITAVADAVLAAVDAAEADAA